MSKKQGISLPGNQKPAPSGDKRPPIKPASRPLAETGLVASTKPISKSIPKPFDAEKMKTPTKNKAQNIREMVILVALMILCIWIGALVKGEPPLSRFEQRKADTAGKFECGAYALPELRGAIEIDVRRVQP